jgi:hypothetical protein
MFCKVRFALIASRSVRLLPQKFWKNFEKEELGILWSTLYSNVFKVRSASMEIVVKPFGTSPKKEVRN